MVALAALAKENGREIGEQIELLVTEALIDAGLFSPEQAAFHRLRESLIRRFLDTAVAIVSAEGHRNDITAETSRRVLQVPLWKNDYETY